MVTMSTIAQRIYDYISRLWFIAGNAVLSNGGTKRPADLLLPERGVGQP